MRREKEQWRFSRHTTHREKSLGLRPTVLSGKQLQYAAKVLLQYGHWIEISDSLQVRLNVGSGARWTSNMRHTEKNSEDAENRSVYSHRSAGICGRIVNQGKVYGFQWTRLRFESGDSLLQQSGTWWSISTWGPTPQWKTF